MTNTVLIIIAIAFVVVYFVMNLIRKRYDYKQTQQYINPNEISMFDMRLAEFTIETPRDLENAMNILAWVDSVVLEFDGIPRRAVLRFPDGVAYSRLIHAQALEKADFKVDMLQKIHAGEDADWERVSE
ncbi:MAG: hypothetical protein LBN02_00170 [Oscillospiraceae bacterium]|jgi:hypothetical protein|nr:hypothetical protein [Oscillospiraceae bacterium]